MANNGNSKINGYFVNSDSDSNVSADNGEGGSNRNITDNAIPYTNEYREPVPLSPQAAAALRAMVEEQAAAGRARAATMRARQGSIGSPIQPGSSPRIHVMLPGSAGRSPNIPTSSSAMAGGLAQGSPTGNALCGSAASAPLSPNVPITQSLRDSLRAAEQARIDGQTQAGNYGGGHIPQPKRLDDTTEATIRGMAEEQASSERARSASLIAATQATVDAETAAAQVETQTQSQAATAATAGNPQVEESGHRRNGEHDRLSKASKTSVAKKSKRDAKVMAAQACNSDVNKEDEESVYWRKEVKESPNVGLDGDATSPRPSALLSLDEQSSAEETKRKYKPPVVEEEASEGGSTTAGLTGFQANSCGEDKESEESFLRRNEVNTSSNTNSNLSTNASPPMPPHRLPSPFAKAIEDRKARVADAIAGLPQKKTYSFDLQPLIDESL